MTDLPVDRHPRGGVIRRDGPTLLGRLAKPAFDAVERYPQAALVALGAWTLVLGVLAVRSPASVIGLLLLSGLVVAVLRFPEAALVLLLFFEPFHNALYAVVTGRFGVLSFQNAALWKDVLIGALFLRGLARQLVAGRTFTEMFRPGDRALLGYGLLLALIATVSPNLTAAGYALAVSAEGPILFLAIMLLRPSRRQLRVCLWAMLAAATIMGVTAVIEQGPGLSFDPWFGKASAGLHSSFVLGNGGYRSGSFLGSPLQLAFYGAGMAALATGVAMGTRSLWRVLAILAVACIGAGVVVSYTRSGYIGGGVGVLLAVSLGARRLPVRLALVGAMVVLAGSLAGLSVASGDEHLAHSGEGTGHLDALRSDLNLFAARPLGYGLGSVDAIGQRFDQNGGLATESALLAKGVQGGVEELVAYLAVLFWTAMRLRNARRAALATGDGEAAGLCAGALGAQLAIFLAGFFLGVEALPVEVVLWGAPAIALAFASAPAD